MKTKAMNSETDGRSSKSNMPRTIATEIASEAGHESDVARSIMTSELNDGILVKLQLSSGFDISSTSKHSDSAEATITS
jgi:hypothetical protein